MGRERGVTISYSSLYETLFHKTVMTRMRLFEAIYVTSNDYENA